MRPKAGLWHTPARMRSGAERQAEARGRAVSGRVAGARSAVAVPVGVALCLGLGCGVPSVSFVDASADGPEPFEASAVEAGAADAGAPDARSLEGGGLADSGHDADVRDASSSADAGLPEGGAATCPTSSPPGYNLCCGSLPCGGTCKSNQCKKCEATCSPSQVCCFSGNGSNAALTCQTSGPCP